MNILDWRKFSCSVTQEPPEQPPAQDGFFSRDVENPPFVDQFPNEKSMGFPKKPSGKYKWLIYGKYMDNLWLMVNSYPLVMTNITMILWNITIEIVNFPMKNGNFQ